MKQLVILLGNVGGDPEFKVLESGTAMAKFSLAVNEGYKDKNGEWQNHTEWFKCVAWGKTAERVEKAVKKGQPLYIEGKIKSRSWEDQDGHTRYAWDVIVNYFRKIGQPGTGDLSTGTGAGNAAVPVTEGEPPAEDGDDLPF